MVLSSLAPLFVLWAIRGSCAVSDSLFVPACLILAVVPTLLVGLGIRTAKKHREIYPIYVGSHEDQRIHVLSYLFAILLPFYRTDADSARDLAAMVVALACIVFLFWKLRLHYMNILSALLGYSVFRIVPPPSRTPHDEQDPCVLITYRRYLVSNQRIDALRLSNTVYFEMREPQH